MNRTVQQNYLEQVFSRSCVESSPLPIVPRQEAVHLATHSSSRTQSQLHQLKRQLLHLVLEKANESRLFKPICGVANQAAEQAWNRSCPLLVFPCLFEELVQIADEQFRPEQAWQTDDSPWPPFPQTDANHNGKPSIFDSVTLAAACR